MMHVKQFRSIVFTRAIVVLLVGAAACGALSYLLNNYLGIGIVSSLLVAGVLSMAGIGWGLWIVVQRAMQPLAHVAYSLEHLDEGKTPEKPAEELHGTSKALTRALLKDIYNLAGNAHQAQAELHKKLEVFRALFDLSPVATLAFNRHNKLKIYNQSAHWVIPSTFEDPSGEDMDAVLPLEFKEGQTLDQWLEACRKDKIREHRVFSQVTLRNVEGEEKLVDVVAHYSKDESHGLEVILEVVEHTDFYQKLRNQSSFVSLAVHELRSPITLLRGYIEVFEDELGGKVEGDMQDFMHKMSVAASQLSLFVNNILNVARIDSDSLNINLQEADWVNILSEAAEQFQLRANVKNRKVILKIDDKLPKVAVDQTSILEVLSNLVDNAIKYSHDGGEIIIRAKDSGEGMVETTVEDHGIGIPSSIINNLFEKFYRSHRTKENVGGTGLGLYLSKAIIESHGGNIWVRSTEGKGSTFGFTIPTADNVEKNPADAAAGIERSAHGWIKNHGAIRK